MFNLLVAALPETTLAQVMDIINNIPAVNPFDVLKLKLLEAQLLSDQEKMDVLFQLGPLGDRKPSQLMASRLSVCPLGMEIQPLFQYLFLQRLPNTLRTLLGKQDCGDICALVALADRLWASHKPQPQEVITVQKLAGDQQVAAVQPKKKYSDNGSGSSGNCVSGGCGGILSHTEQARVGSNLCFKHFCYGAAARGYTKPCNLGGLTQSPLGFYLFPQRCFQSQPWRRLTLKCPLGCQLPP